MRGYIRPSRRHSERAQRKVLEGAGAIYVEGPEATLQHLISALRPKDIVLVTTLGRLGRSRRDLQVAIDDIHSRKAIIVEATTQRRSNRADDLKDMIFDAVDELAEDRRVLTGKKAREYGSQGGKEAAKRAASKRMPKAEAERIWFDLRNKTTRDAIDQMRGWTLRMAYTHFGGRLGVPGIGRPRKR